MFPLKFLKKLIIFPLYGSGTPVSIHLKSLKNLRREIHIFSY